MKRLIYTLIIILLSASCVTRKVEVAATSVEGNSWGITKPATAMVVPSVIIYKTRADYNDHVPVIMDMTATHIISYPDPSDLLRNDGSMRKPTQLNEGYLLDNKGINAHTAFLDYTYEEYVGLDSVPNSVELLEHIIDKYPFVEMWDCGKKTKYRDLVDDLNKLIDDKLTGCRPIIYKY